MPATTTAPKVSPQCGKQVDRLRISMVGHRDHIHKSRSKGIISSYAISGRLLSHLGVKATIGKPLDTCTQYYFSRALEAAALGLTVTIFHGCHTAEKRACQLGPGITVDADAEPVSLDATSNSPNGAMTHATNEANDGTSGWTRTNRPAPTSKNSRRIPEL